MSETQLLKKIESLVRQMTLEEKITMLSGDSTGFNGPGIDRLGIPPIKMADGPVGVRVGAATAFPVSVNMAASWDTALIYRYGKALGEETRAKGKTVILGPCVGIQRFPLGGRNFESLGEDPCLSSRLTVNYVKGVQENHVIATIKHYACNDQEWQRNFYDAIVDERSLREVHLAPFEAAVKEAGVRAVMTSYNIINGQHASENQHLVKEILKDDWGFKGIVMSDWVSVYSAVNAANNGLDIEMPKAIWFGDSLKKAIKNGLVSEETINGKIRRHLWVRFNAGLFEHGNPIEDQTIIESADHQNLALEMAQKSIILAYNKDEALPLSKEKLKSIALIGPHANVARTGGGGSSIVHPWRKVSPKEALENLLGKKVQLLLAEGVSVEPFKAEPIPAEFLRTPDGRKGLYGEYFNNQGLKGKPEFSRIDEGINFGFGGGSPDPRIKNDDFGIRWTGKIVPPVSKKYKLAIKSDDGSYLYINDKLMVDNGGQHGEVQLGCELYMEAGKEYKIRIEFNENGGDAAMRLLWQSPFTEQKEPSVEEAEAIAKQADLAIVCVGNSLFNEAEGADIQDFTMIAGQDELVSRVANANPNTIVVVYGGVPVSMRNWIDKVKAVIIAGYPGQEGGTALAQILFGEVNPSGKLPYSYIQDKSESPAFENYKNQDLRVPYAEGVFVGYKYYEKNGISPLFPFGHGLSYTTFEYNNLSVEKLSETSFQLKVDICNTGKFAGEEVVQVYIGRKKSNSSYFPVKELRGFAKIALNAGEAKTVQIMLDDKAFRYWDTGINNWAIDKADYAIYVGSSSADIKLQSEISLE